MFIDKGGIDDSGITVLKKPYKKTELAEAVRAIFDR